GEGDDAIELGLHLLAGEAEERAVEVDVVAAAQLGVEARAELDHRAQPPLGRERAFARLQDAGHGLEERALTRSIVADERERFPRRDLERDVAQRPEGLRAAQVAEP